MIDAVQDASQQLSAPVVGPALPSLLAKTGPAADFMPREPGTLEDAGLTRDLVESLIFKFLLNYGSASGRRVADQVKLPFRLVYQLLQSLKSQLLVGYKGAAAMSDYEYELSSAGVERAGAATINAPIAGLPLSLWPTTLPALSSSR